VSIFVDTSALYAAVNAQEDNHQRAKEGWDELARRREVPVTSNYVLLETVALLGHRLGMQAVRIFQTEFAPILRVHWVDEALHDRAVAALLTAGERRLSLVDCVSFELMRRIGIDTAFTFDAHFAKQGFRCLP
jgi:predicted nucleic acid-binding protein